MEMVEFKEGIQSHEEPQEIDGNTVRYSIEKVVQDEQSFWKYNEAKFEGDISDEVKLAIVRKKQVASDKAKKLKAIDEISVETNSVEYDAHTRGRADMSSIVALANFQFIQAVVANNEELQPLYDAVYKSTLDWKGKDNLVHEVQVESIAETAISAYEEYAKVIGAK